MIGVVVVTHRGLGSELIGTAEFILGKITGITAVTVDAQASAEVIRAAVKKGSKQVAQGAGVMSLTDMFGGTPASIGLSFLKTNQVEVLTGVNLPMIIKLIQSREKLKLDELAKSVGEYGRKSINVASEILNRRPED